jgi:hypothetical protein
VAAAEMLPPSIVSDFFNLSIPTLHRTKDGGFGAVARAGQLSRVGLRRERKEKAACVSEKTQ